MIEPETALHAEIEELQAENKRLREALEQMVGARSIRREYPWCMGAGQRQTVESGARRVTCQVCGDGATRSKSSGVILRHKDYRMLPDEPRYMSGLEMQLIARRALGMKKEEA